MKFNLNLRYHNLIETDNKQNLHILFYAKQPKYLTYFKKKIQWIIPSKIVFCVFVCLFVFFFVPLENFSLIWRCEGLQILTYSRHKWQLSSEGSFACHIYCDTGHPFIIPVCNGHLRGPLTLTPIAERLAVKLSLSVFTTYICRAWDSNNRSCRT